MGDPDETSTLEVAVNQVLSPEYFRTLGIRLLRGRSFTEAEIPAPGREPQTSVILDESLARRLFGTVDVLGQSLEIASIRGQGKRYEVIGVAADVRFFGLTEEPELILYDPSGLSVPRDVVFTVRATSDPAATIQSIAASLDTSIPVEIVRMTQAIRRARFEWDILGWLMTVLAAAATFLAAIGVYGLVAFAAASRRHEFGIRMAIGATQRAIHWLVLRRASSIAIAGLMGGLVGAFGLSQMLRSRLFGVQPFEPVLWIISAAALVAIFVATALFAARKATRLSVADTLRTT